MTRCIWGGRCSSRKVRAIVNRFGINHVVVVKDKGEIVREGGNLVEQSQSAWLRLVAAEGLEAHPAPLLQYSAQPSAKPRRGRSESVRGRYPLRPATARRRGRSQPATHSLTSVVLPKPAGAEIRVSFRCRPSFSRSIRRGRRTTLGRGGGIYSLVARIVFHN